ncbi:MAG: nucleotidyltransferase domain-containing protein [Candidatus Desulfofervidus auxilii]|nr:nucleotidyltransferase domain-containing protein [Candidatus Desulfofervidus auxilii]
MSKIFSEIFSNSVEKLLEKTKTFYKKNLIAVVIFGSGGKGEISVNSDVDLFIVINESKLSLRQRITEFFENVSDTITIGPFILLLSPLIFTKKETQKFSPLYLDMLEGCIILYDKGNFMKNLLKKVKILIQQKVIERYEHKGKVYWRINYAAQINSGLSF